jgi:hypothetical protein
MPISKTYSWRELNAFLSNLVRIISLQLMLSLRYKRDSGQTGLAMLLPSAVNVEKQKKAHVTVSFVVTSSGFKPETSTAVM